MTNLKAKIEFKNPKNFDSLDIPELGCLVVGIGNDSGRLKLSPKVKDAKTFKNLLETLSKGQNFKAKHGTLRSLLHHGVDLGTRHKHEHILAVGTGSPKDFFPQNILKLGGKISQAISTYKLDSIDIHVDSFFQSPQSSNGPKDFAGRAHPSPSPKIEDCLEKLALGIVLGLYRFENYKKVDSKNSTIPTLRFVSQLLDSKKGAAILSRVNILSEGVYLTRDLQTLPSNDLTPELLAKAAQSSGKAAGFKVQVFDEKKLASMKMNGILSVGQGSSNPPRLIVMEYNPSQKKSAPLILIGKGVTFDTGGTSLKPAPGMEEMKMDMSGAAAVVGAIYSLAKLKVKRRIIAIIPSAENRVSSTSTNPGDIYTAYNGKTVEVLNTDAEGRLILADALSYAAEFKPECVVDVATLTGGVLIALGHECTGLMGNNYKTTKGYHIASDKAGEKTWELPLLEEYGNDLKSNIADYRNIGSNRFASSPKAGCFLNFFVDGKYPWVHLDVAGTADTPSGQGPHCPEHVGTGVPVRGLVEFFENYNSYVK